MRVGVEVADEGSTFADLRSRYQPLLVREHVPFVPNS